MGKPADHHEFQNDAVSTRAASEKRFRSVYRDVVRDVAALWTPEMQVHIARHNAGWHPDSHDIIAYLERSEIRFVRAAEMIGAVERPLRVCDVGGFFGVWVVTLARLGHHSTMTESLQYYGSTFERLFAFISNEGVQIVDTDPFEPDSRLGEDTYDVVSLLAVMEHYPHSVRTLLQNVGAALLPNGRLLLDVPNIAFWPHRTALLRGQSPLVDASTVYDSDVPFTGHHHEFTQAELVDLMAHAGWVCEQLETFDYSIFRPPLRSWVRHPLRLGARVAASRWIPSAREIIMGLFTATKNA